MTGEKGDFSADLSLIRISAMATVIGVVCAYIALVLQWLIGFFTNLFFHQQISFIMDSPAGNSLGLLVIVIPVVGGLVIGLMARYGSDRIRGHGIPEAIEAILIGQSRMSPRVAILKPLSSAISIGSGGPFGAEGPIIMTGGAFGSIIAQLFHLSAAERKTLLVAGAAAGMTATFGTPVASVLLAVELLLFEWKPRSFVPVALASAAAGVVRPFLTSEGFLGAYGLGPVPLFPPDQLHPHLGWTILLCSIGVGALAGLLALFLTQAVYTMEDLFLRLPIHWMWWPAIGGLAIGVGGYYQPEALGVGYDVIRKLLLGKYAGGDLLVVLLPLVAVKCWIWSTALGSGTSGGVLAPLLMMGGALGALESGLLPGNDPGLWALISMGAVLGGTMRSPLTSVVFALELTHDINTLPALLIASTVAHGFTVLVMKRSILTEKVARRGFHVSREYSVDPLERISVAEVMATDLVTIPASMPLHQVITEYFVGGKAANKHQGYPVVDSAGNLLGVLTRRNLLEHWVSVSLDKGEGLSAADPIIAYDVLDRAPIVAYPWESCRTAAERMAQAGVGRLPVVSPDHSNRLVGIITRSDLLKPRARNVEEEMMRQRFLGAATH